MTAMPDTFLVATDHGDVVVRVNDVATGLDPGLFTVVAATPEDSARFEMAVPLRAFGAKVVDIVQGKGTGDLPGGERLLRLMMQEKATEELRRIERWARDHAASRGGR